VKLSLLLDPKHLPRQHAFAQQLETAPITGMLVLPACATPPNSSTP
jgi:hypothetical protein